MPQQKISHKNALKTTPTNYINFHNFTILLQSFENVKPACMDLLDLSMSIFLENQPDDEFDKFEYLHFLGTKELIHFDLETFDNLVNGIVANVKFSENNKPTISNGELKFQSF